MDNIEKTNDNLWKIKFRKFLEGMEIEEIDILMSKTPEEIHAFAVFFTDVIKEKINKTSTPERTPITDEVWAR
jgi:hypothetical protein